MATWRTGGMSWSKCLGRWETSAAGELAPVARSALARWGMCGALRHKRHRHREIPPPRRRHVETTKQASCRVVAALPHPGQCLSGPDITQGSSAPPSLCLLRSANALGSRRIIAFISGLLTATPPPPALRCRADPHRQVCPCTALPRPTWHARQARCGMAVSCRSRAAPPASSQRTMERAVCVFSTAV